MFWADLPRRPGPAGSPRRKTANRPPGLSTRKKPSRNTRVFVGGKIDHAIRNDHIGLNCQEAEYSRFRLSKTRRFSAPGLALVFVREREHLIRPYPSRYAFAGRGRRAFAEKQDVDAAAGAQIEDHFTGI